jgi:hypothetical protein
MGASESFVAPLSSSYLLLLSSDATLSSVENKRQSNRRNLHERCARNLVGCSRAREFIVNDNNAKRTGYRLIGIRSAVSSDGKVTCELGNSEWSVVGEFLMYSTWWKKEMGECKDVD